MKYCVNCGCKVEELKVPVKLKGWVWRYRCHKAGCGQRFEVSAGDDMGGSSGGLTTQKYDQPFTDIPEEVV